MSTIIGTGHGTLEIVDLGFRIEKKLRRRSTKTTNLLAGLWILWTRSVSRLPFDKLRAGKAAPTVLKTRYHATRLARKDAPTVTPKTVAYSNILIYDLLSGKRVAVIQPIDCALEGLESI